jgi:hypothetical protein
MTQPRALSRRRSFPYVPLAALLAHSTVSTERRISRVVRTPELPQSVTERVRLLQDAAVDYRGRLIETLSKACGRLYAK